MKAALCMLLWLLAWASHASAEVRVYLVPQIGTGTPITDPFRPKYVAALGVTWEGLRYGAENVYLVAADVTPAQHTTIAANGDVTALPQNIGAQVGANLNTVQTTLEAINIPATWILTSHTYRQILYVTATVIVLRQRFAQPLFGGGITLNSTIGDLTVAQRNRLQAVADSLALNTSNIALNTTIRQALRLLAQQLPPLRLLREPIEP